MIEDFVPVEVIQNNKKTIWQIDVSKLSIVELMKLKESLKDTTFNPTITMLDKLIYSSTDTFNGMRGNMYTKEMKNDHKIKNKIKQKTRRK